MGVHPPPPPSTLSPLGSETPRNTPGLSATLDLPGHLRCLNYLCVYVSRTNTNRTLMQMLSKLFLPELCHCKVTTHSFRLVHVRASLHVKYSFNRNHYGSFYSPLINFNQSEDNQWLSILQINVSTVTVLFPNSRQSSTRHIVFSVSKYYKFGVRARVSSQSFNQPYLIFNQCRSNIGSDIKEKRLRFYSYGQGLSAAWVWYNVHILF